MFSQNGAKCLVVGVTRNERQIVHQFKYLFHTSDSVHRSENSERRDAWRTHLKYGRKKQAQHDQEVPEGVAEDKLSIFIAMTKMSNELTISKQISQNQETVSHLDKGLRMRLLAAAYHFSASS
jgi:hypothetical protein